MFSFFKKKDKKAPTTYALATVVGNIFPVKDLKDGVFSENMLGEGIYIEPLENKFYAPVSGILETVFPTKHAFGIRTSEGITILVHIGIDTVSLNGKGFTSKVKQGDFISEGELLAEVDFAILKENNISKSTVVIVTGESSKKASTMLTSGKVTLETKIFEF
ncbi:PTS sugar transporter subunit IIA [[Mycoplasma] mobile]|uniref:Pts system enzyme iia component n=1 Tax=Mycoplasma mobile (strain ATCC 43663 / 163K / NCTC 11711) TaxID=267748 RepID=Q6KIM5_MYCM1|nr:PTS glucose transporter subunit IIA [[Mycoplasma] mobile]AAT27551.1 pts system enzyme iia component [Mycoplasma mobile 163K]